MNGMITQIQHFSLHDGPGIRTTLFFKGCNLSCRWCHNPENIWHEPETLVYRDSGITVQAGREISLEEALTEILKDRIFYEASGGGVTFSGGEPTLQKKFLYSLAEACRTESVHTALNSNFTFSEETATQLVDRFDLFITDIKITDAGRHRQFTGLDNSRILENIRRFAGLRKPLTVRLPLIHGINTDEKGLAGVRSFLAAISPYEQLTIEILPYHRFGESKYAALGLDYTVFNAEVPVEVQERFTACIDGLGFHTKVNTW